jgi:hypothetical protein
MIKFRPNISHKLNKDAVTAINMAQPAVSSHINV